MMIHLALNWSKITEATLWPMSVNHAEWIYKNHIPTHEDWYLTKEFMVKY